MTTMHFHPHTRLFCRFAFMLIALPCLHSLAADEKIFPGATEQTPSRAHYFSWINNAWEGSTEAQTLINLEFFRWLHDEYGMQLDCYAFDAGNLDTQGEYGSTDSQKFKAKFPEGFGRIAAKAREVGCRLGMWAGPDGFGDTPEEEQRRIEMMVKLCRDDQFALLKLDACASNLRPEKQDAFIRMMKACREYQPGLIVLNHRIDFGKAAPYATTFLFEGAETYIDIHMSNEAVPGKTATVRFGNSTVGENSPAPGWPVGAAKAVAENPIVLRDLVLRHSVVGTPLRSQDMGIPPGGRSPSQVTDHDSVKRLS